MTDVKQKLSNSVLRICQHSRGFRQIILPFQIIRRPGGQVFNLFQHICFLPTETDDYAEIIDEEDTYTMPSSK